MQRVCVIIGAGPGIGMAAARRFAREGFRPVLVARRTDKLTELAAELRDEGIDAFTIAADTAEPGAMAWTFQQIGDEIGPVDVLVYNAAVINPAQPSALDPETLVQEFRVGVAGALAAVQQVIGPMKTAGHGTILLTGGGFSLYPRAAMASLSVSKAGIRSLAHTLAEELAPAGIHVATVTVMGVVKPGTAFDPDKIADVYWELHQQPKESWQTEVQFTGA